jgi:DNA-binding Lrp family transcriptional regulator
LLETACSWPPILVHEPTFTVLDGLHRIEAARRLGWNTIPAKLVADLRSGWLLALKENVRHGLALSLSDRRRAARAIIASFPGWSDVRIAEAAGLSRSTIRTLRGVGNISEQTVPPVEGEFPALDVSARRLGRDDRARPVDPSGLRKRISAALEQDSGASLRAIARRVGASPETVRAVRREMVSDSGRLLGPDRLPGSRDRQVATGTATLSAVPLPERRVQRPPAFMTDTACGSTEQGRLFAEWFDTLAVQCESLEAHAEAVPVSRLYEVIDEAERRAGTWQQFAALLRTRIH